MKETKKQTKGKDKTWEGKNKSMEKTTALTLVVHHFTLLFPRILYDGCEGK